MNTIKKISIFGSTGSIGTSALKVIDASSNQFKVDYLSTNKNIELLFQQSLQYKPKAVIIADDNAYKLAKNSFNFECKVYEKESLVEVCKNEDFDILLAALVGFAGLESSIEAIKSNKTIALANKETLVVAGELITELLKKYNSKLIPVDSEHSAIFQCLVGENSDSISNLILTASGGPFLNKNIHEFDNITLAEALKHPNWNMGNKITIDSATLMNKGLEVIEAHWLFGVKHEKIKVLIHPQSIIHSMVEFTDGSIKAQLGIPDMKLPIQYALFYPVRANICLTKMDFIRYNTLNFYEPEFEKFRCLNLAFDTLKDGGTAPVILNAANEIAVDYFLKEKIKFSKIPEMIEKALTNNNYLKKPNLNDIIECDKETREYCRRLV